MRSSYSEKRMRNLIAEWKRGDLSRMEFCRRKRISYATFGYWLRKCEVQMKVDESFIPIEVDTGIQHTEIEIQYPGGVMLRIGGKPDIKFIESLLRISL